MKLDSENLTLENDLQSQEQTQMPIKANRKMIWLFLFSLLYVLVCFGWNFIADFWFIDDHQTLAALLNIRKGFSFWDIIKNTELGNWGGYTRFRPSFFFLQTAETFLYGSLPWAWYAFRLLILQQFVFLSLYWLSKAWSIWIVLLVGIGLFSPVYWSDIFGRLGAGEAYSCLGLVLIGYGVLVGRHFDSARLWSAILCLLGAIIFAGSKEHLTILTGAVCLGLLIIPSKFFRRSEKALIFLVGVYCFWIVLGVLLSMRSNPIDVNGHSTSVIERFIFLKGLLKAKSFFVVLGTLFVLGSLQKLGKRNYRVLIYVVIGMVLFYILNYSFYSGNWPMSNRYDFPVGMFLPICFGILASVGLDHLSLHPKKQWVFCFLLLGVVSAFPHLKGLYRESVENVRRTHHTRDTISRIRDLGRDNPNATFVLEVSHPVGDYEYAFSVKRFLEYFDFKNNVVVRNSFDPNAFSSPFEMMLTQNLKNFSNNMPVVPPCFSIFLSKVEANECKDIGIIVH